MPFPPAFTDVWDITQPPDTQLLNQGALDFRTFRLDIMQRMSLLSGLFANRPTLETVNATWGGAGYGLVYFSTDTSQIFQWNGASWADISSVFVGAKLVATFGLAAQAADVGATTMYNVPASSPGIYRISMAIVLTQQATISSTLPHAIVTYTDLDTSVVIGRFVTDPSGSNTLGTTGGPAVSSSLSIPAPGAISVKASTAIQVSTSGYASNGATPMQFSLRARLEFLG